MAAQAWELYNSAIGHLADGVLDLDTQNFWVQLHTGASNASDLTLSDRTSLTNELANGNGYTTGGVLLSARTWTSAASGVWMFDGSDRAWTASGAAKTSIVFAVIRNSASVLVCKSKLTTTGFISVGDGGTLTLQMNANGIFRLSRA